MHPFYAMRAIGGALVTVGFGIMLYNFVKTLQAAKAEEGQQPVAASA
ncbi:MAG: hypothetical protein GQ467_06295 [Mariprofundaceae bacterium]|nr:hypothetical protein [Mariprofundaceae bacterium]